MRPGAVIFDRISHLVSGSYKVTMGSDDGTDSELDKYAPKWVRERPAAPKRLRSVGTSTSTPRWSEEEHRDRRIRSLRPEPVPEPPARPKDRLRLRRSSHCWPTLGNRYYKIPGCSSQIHLPYKVSKPADPRLTANDAPPNRALVSAAGIAAAPSATAQTQQVPISPAQQQQQAALSTISKPLGQERSVSIAVRGVRQ